jgi:2-polyprenyl-6-methoxyphenol hydroxylase-like FAD-dependent oxidoreductase
MSVAQLASQRVSIIGAGLAGLVAAHGEHTEAHERCSREEKISHRYLTPCSFPLPPVGLSHVGFRHIRLYDSSPSFSHASPALRGGGVILSSTGVKVIERLSGGLVAEEVRKWARPIDHVSARTLAGQAIHSYTPSELSRNGATGGKGYPYWAVHGAKLHDALSSTLPSSVQVTFNASLSRISRTADNIDANSDGDQPKKDTRAAPLNLHFDESDKKGIDSDLVIGADGPSSTVRASIPHLSLLTPKDLGGQYIRGLCKVRESLKDGEGRVLQPDDELHEVWGKGEKFSWYWLDPHTIAWLGLTQKNRTRAQMFRAFSPPIPELIRQSAEESIQEYPIMELAPHAQPYSSDARLILIGDAAHCPTQELWQSLSLDCEDAVTLAALLGSAGRDRKEAVEMYGTLRYPRLHSLSTSSHSETVQALQTGGILTALRDVASSMMPPSVVREQMKTVLGYDAASEVQAVRPGAQF